MNSNFKDIDQLIQLISTEVIKKIKEMSGDKPEVIPVKILLLGDSEKSQWLEESIDSNYEVHDLETFREIKDIGYYDYIILEDLENSVLANLARGIDKDPIEEIIIQGILLDKKIHVLEEGISYRQYEKTCNKNFFKLLKDYENRIMSYGIAIVSKTQMISLIKKERLSDLEDETYQPEEIWKMEEKVVTETKLERVFLKGYRKIRINYKAIITPLASDYIKANRIEIVRR